jgi:methylmalonyl-CoA/ethylmalonyl-CoA epimerase
MPKLNHIAVLVADLDEAIKLFNKVWGLEPSGIHTLEKQGIRTATYEFDNILVELMEPYGDSSTVGKALEKRGPGIHHMAVECDDVSTLMKKLKDDGLRFTTEEPAVGLNDSLICFLHPKSTHGILTELVQPAKE